MDISQNIARQLFDSSHFLKENTTITIFGNVMYSIANQAVALIANAHPTCLIFYSK